MEARFACGSVVLYYLFHEIWLFEPNVREKDPVFSALPEAKTPFG